MLFLVGWVCMQGCDYRFRFQHLLTALPRNAVISVSPRCIAEINETPILFDSFATSWREQQCNYVLFQSDKDLTVSFLMLFSGKITTTTVNSIHCLVFVNTSSVPTQACLMTGLLAVWISSLSWYRLLSELFFSLECTFPVFLLVYDFYGKITPLDYPITLHYSTTQPTSV